jgi:hypothetical protein
LSNYFDITYREDELADTELLLNSLWRRKKDAKKLEYKATKNIFGVSYTHIQNPVLK